MQESDRKVLWALVFALVVTTAMLAWVAFIGTANSGAHQASSEEARGLFLGFSPEAWTAIFTAVLTASTIGLWLQTKRLATGAEEQSRDMKASIAAAQKAADAAVGAQRPWVDFEFKAVEPLVFDADGCHGSFSIKPTNIGNTPAVKVRDSVILTVLKGRRTFEKGFNQLAERRKNFGKGTADGYTIFPNEKRPPLTYKISVPQSEIEPVAKAANGMIHFHALVSVDYKFAGGAGNTTRNYFVWTRGADEFDKWARLDLKKGTYPVEDIVITGVPAKTLRHRDNSIVTV